MDVDKIKKLFILHFEKMLLGLVVAGALFLVYSGFKMPNFLEEHQPDKLAANASRVKLEIDDDHTAAIITERIPTFDILKQTKILDTPVPPSIYKPKHLWEPQSENSIVRRQDPLLLPPLDLRTHGVLTSIAIKGSTTEGDYPLTSLEPADAVEKVEKPQPRERRQNRRGGGGMEEMMQMQMEMMQMDSMPMESEISMMGGGSSRRLTPKFDFGFRPIMGKDKRYPKPSIGWFIAGTALLPHREIYEAYEQSLRDADGYNPMRDTPLYFNFKVARADVTDKPVDQLVDADWVEIMDLKKYAMLAAGYWSGFAPEIVPEDYRDKQLTIWIPPVLLDDYRPFSVHPRIPKLTKMELTRNEIKKEADAEANNIGEFKFDETGDVTLNVPGAGMSGMMNDMMSGMDQMDMMSGGGMMMFGQGKVEEDPVDHKLMRFYDFAGSSLFKNAPVFGHTYVYRLKYSVVDPNFPASQTMQPKTSSLAPEVARRVVDLMNDAVANKKRDFQLWSEWSAPSEPATLPTLEEYFVGPVEAGSTSTWSVNGRPVEYSRDVPKAKMVVSQYVPKYAAKVPMQINVTEGSVFSRKAESADVVDPVSLEVKKLPEPDYVSSTTVVDVNGGRPLQITADLTEPGLILLFDQSGVLRLNDEIADQEFYRIKSFAEEKGE